MPIKCYNFQKSTQRFIVQFNEYLKSCREKYELTQEELVQELYNFDDIFMGLDVGTLSRWERGTTQPNTDKQVNILKLFKSKSNHILSCFEGMDRNLIENEICKRGVKNLIGASKEHILTFPTKSFKMDYTSISHIRTAQDIDKALAMPYSTILNLTGNVYNLSLEDIKKWALHPSNLFLLSEYHEQYSGMLFTLRLKPATYQKIINFEININDIDESDFASFKEKGSNFAIAFFAYNDKNATLLFLRYYAHLIANQDLIENVGATPVLTGAKKIVQKMNMKHYIDKETDKGTLSSYSATLEDILLNESVLKMLFQKQECPEDEN